MEKCKIRRVLGDFFYVLAGFFKFLFFIAVVAGCMFHAVLGMYDFVRHPEKAKKFVYGLDYEERKP